MEKKLQIHFPKLFFKKKVSLNYTLTHFFKKNSN